VSKFQHSHMNMENEMQSCRLLSTCQYELCVTDLESKTKKTKIAVWFERTCQYAFVKFGDEKLIIVLFSFEIRIIINKYNFFCSAVSNPST
jgi:hypothetical protein